MKVQFFVFLTILITFNLSADWFNTYGITLDERGYSAQPTSDLGYIVTGRTDISSSNVYLIKTDSGGDTIWTKSIGGSGNDIGYSVQQINDGGYIIVGSTNSFGAGEYDVYLIRVDSLGDTVWTKVYGGGYDDTGFDVQQTNEGGFIIVGRIQLSPSSEALYLIKTNSSGDTLWCKIHVGGVFNYGHSIQQIDDGGYIITGSYYNLGTYDPDVYLIRMDSNGDSLWSHRFGYVGSEHGKSVQQTSDGGFIVAGYTNSFGAGYEDIYLIKTDSLGNIQWSNTFGGSSADYGESVQQTSDGGYIIAGRTYSFGAGSYDIYVVKTDSGGNLLWERTYGGSDGDYGQSVQLTSDGGFIISGFTSSYGIGDDDVFLLYMDLIPPEAFNLIYPENNSGIPVTNLQFIWHSTTDYISQYDVYIDGIKRITTTDTVWNIDYNLNTGMHSWFVIAIDSFNLSTSTDTFTFEVDTTFPLTPILLEPVNGIIYSDTLVSFHWSEVTRKIDLKFDQRSNTLGEATEIRYVLEIDTNPSFNTAYQDTLAETTDTLIMGENIFYWQVKAIDLAGNESPYSDVDSFGVDITPPVIESTTVWSDTSFIGPFTVDVKITDNLQLDSSYLFFKRSEDPTFFNLALNSTSNDWYTAEIPKVYLNPDTVKYYLYAYDLASPINEATDPPGAPVNYYSFTVSSVGITEDISIIPRMYAVNLTSPSRKEIIFNLAIPELSKLTLKIYDLSGRLISIPVNGVLSPAYYQIPFQPENRGVYFYSVESEQFNQRGKFIIVE